MNRDKTRWICALFLMVVSVMAPAAQTAKQGEAPSTTDKNAFISPMILETVFAAADRSLWDPAKGYQPGGWFTTQEYESLAQYSCDGVRLRSYDHKQKIWGPGLAMSVTQAEGGMLNVAVRATIDNPKKNHDRRIEILFEVMNGAEVVASATVKRKVEEGEVKPLLAQLTLAPAMLIVEPMTRLRLTVRDTPI